MTRTFTIEELKKDDDLFSEAKTLLGSERFRSVYTVQGLVDRIHELNTSCSLHELVNGRWTEASDEEIYEMQQDGKNVQVDAYVQIELDVRGHRFARMYGTCYFCDWNDDTKEYQLMDFNEERIEIDE